MSLALVILAAGLSTRYGRAKQLEAVGPSGETLLDYAVFDALRAGFLRIVPVVRRELAAPMREHFGRWWAGVDVTPAFQDGDAARATPWGTAHAVLAAADALDGPFGVCNADDFYGARAFVALARHLTARSDEQALVGYRLGETLSPQGGVSRAVCETDGTGLVARLTELRQVRAVGSELRAVDPAGAERRLSSEAVVSMNLWGFTPAVLAPLRDAFEVFRAAHAADPAAEFLVSGAMNELVAAGRARLRALAGGRGWMGITHPGDRDAVEARLRALAADGTYPTPLRPLGALKGRT